MSGRKKLIPRCTTIDEFRPGAMKVGAIVAVAKSIGLAPVRKRTNSFEEMAAMKFEIFPFLPDINFISVKRIK